LAGNQAAMLRECAPWLQSEPVIGRLSRPRLVTATVALFALLAIGVAVLLATHGSNSAKAIKQAARKAPVQSPCADALLKDWADGRIDGSYQLACYQVALKSLPTDLQVYSSASEDIAQALSHRIVQSRARTSAPPGERSRRPAG
jgi:hypothetical protein